MIQDAFEHAAYLLRERAGLKAEGSARARLERLVEEGALGARLATGTYLQRVEADPEAFEELLDRITVQHSDFFRDPAQFSALAWLARDATAPATVWSAGCGNGQEAYSLAILLDEIGHPDWRIVATDVSQRALARTVTGRYTESEVRKLSPERRSRYLVEAAGGFEVAAALRGRVLVAHHNLAQAVRPPISRCDFVFCRNVLMYFGRDEKTACIQRLAKLMKPGGHLFLGHSDAAGEDHRPFETAWVAGCTLLRLALPAAQKSKPELTRRGRARPRDAGALLAEGRTASAGGDLRAAIFAFRQATYLDPDLTVAYLQLGTAFELAGDRREARRAFAAAGLALMRSDSGDDSVAVDGYTNRDLACAIAVKLTRQVA